MTTLTLTKNSTKTSALLGGISLLIMTVAAMFSYGYAHGTLFDMTSASNTLLNLQTSKDLFRLELAGWFTIILMDVFVSYAFYVYLRPVSKIWSAIAGSFRLIYTAIFLIAILQLSNIYGLITSENALSVDVSSQILSLNQNFEFIWAAGLILFGIHLVSTGLVALKSSKIPRILSVLLIIAGVAYTVLQLLTI